MTNPQFSVATMAVLASLSGIGCANRSPSGEPPAPPDTTVSRAGLAGDWELIVVPQREPSAPPFHLTIRVDSLTGSSRAYGRLTHFLRGDVGVDPARFSRFDGFLATDSTVAFAISTADDPPAEIRIAGRLAADTVTVTLFTLGPDTLTRGARRWLLVRRP